MSNLRLYYNSPALYNYNIIDFVKSDNFDIFNINSDLISLVENVDVLSFYFHGIYAVSSIINDVSLIAYGETIIKPIFVFFPREILGNLKPSSMLTLYTTYYDQYYRSAGNSYPVNFFSELIWNFYILAPFFSFIFGYLSKKFNTMTFNSISKGLFLRSTILLTMWFLILNVVRGSGLEYIVYGGLFIYFASILGKYTTPLNYFKK